MTWLHLPSIASVIFCISSVEELSWSRKYAGVRSSSSLAMSPMVSQTSFQKGLICSTCHPFHILQKRIIFLLYQIIIFLLYQISMSVLPSLPNQQWQSVGTMPIIIKWVTSNTLNKHASESLNIYNGAGVDPMGLKTCLHWAPINVAERHPLRSITGKLSCLI